MPSPPGAIGRRRGMTSISTWEPPGRPPTSSSIVGAGFAVSRGSVTGLRSRSVRSTEPDCCGSRSGPRRGPTRLRYPPMACSVAVGMRGGRSRQSGRQTASRYCWPIVGARWSRRFTRGGAGSRRGSSGRPSSGSAVWGSSRGGWSRLSAPRSVRAVTSWIETSPRRSPGPPPVRGIRSRAGWTARKRNWTSGSRFPGNWARPGSPQGRSLALRGARPVGAICFFRTGGTVNGRAG